MDEMHPYERLSLCGTALVLAACLLAAALAMLLWPAPVQGFLKRFPRSQNLGQVLLGIGLFWFWLLIAPPGFGMVSSLQMDLGEFNGAKGILRVLVPVSFFAVSFSVREFLAVRALGLLGLMAAAPLLAAAFQRDPASRLLVPIAAYALILKSLFWVGMPYTFRDSVTWMSATPGRFRACALGTLAYGAAVLVCALSFWRDS